MLSTGDYTWDLLYIVIATMLLAMGTLLELYCGVTVISRKRHVKLIHKPCHAFWVCQKVLMMTIGNFPLSCHLHMPLTLHLLPKEIGLTHCFRHKCLTLARVAKKRDYSTQMMIMTLSRVVSVNSVHQYPSAYRLSASPMFYCKARVLCMYNELRDLIHTVHWNQM